MTQFNKPALTPQQQITLLQSRGMVIAAPDKAAFYLQQINYYRLGAYWLPYESSHSPHAFLPNTTFESILKLYVFDRELRLHLLDAIERVEVAVRTRWAYEMAHRHGPHGYLEAKLSKSIKSWANNLVTLTAEVNRTDEAFIKHYSTNYNEPELPPVWAVCEVMSMGLLSRWYTQLGPTATRKAIAVHFGFDHQQFEGLLDHLTYLRNVCAHHSRVWNRKFTKTMPLPRNKPSGLREQLNLAADRQLYNTLVCLLHLMDTICPQHHWRNRLLDLVAGLNTQQQHAMGYPSGWETHPIWKRDTL